MVKHTKGFGSRNNAQNVEELHRRSCVGVVIGREAALQPFPLRDVVDFTPIKGLWDGKSL